MENKHRIDAEEIKERKEFYFKKVESQGNLYDILNKLDPARKTLSIEETIFLDNIVTILATYDTFHKLVENEIFSEEQDKDRLEDFANLYSLYAAFTEGMHVMKDKLPSETEKHKGYTNKDLGQERFNFDEMKVKKKPTLDDDLKEFELPDSSISETRYMLDEIKSITTAIALNSNTYKFNDLVGIIFEYMRGLNERVVKEIEKPKYTRFLSAIESINIQINDITLQGLNYRDEEKADANLMDITFDDIVGNNDLIGLLQDIGDKMLRYDTETKKSAEKFPTALLVKGSPGCGKSMAIAAFAKYLKDNGVHPYNPGKTKEVQTIILDASMKSKWYGETEANLKSKMDAARDPTKLNIVVMDDIDVLFAQRSNERENEVEKKNTGYMLELIQGVYKRFDRNTLIIATTNIDFQMDAALRRRFLPVEATGPEEGNDYAKLVELELRKGLEEYYDTVVKIRKEGFDELGRWFADKNRDMSGAKEDAKIEEGIEGYRFSGSDINQLISKITTDVTRISEKKGKRPHLQGEEERAMNWNGYESNLEYNKSVYAKRELTAEMIIGEAKKYAYTSKLHQIETKNKEREEIIERGVEGRLLEDEIMIGYAVKSTIAEKTEKLLGGIEKELRDEEAAAKTD